LQEQLQEELQKRAGRGEDLSAVELPVERLAMPGEKPRVVEPDEARALAPYFPPAGGPLEPINEELKLGLHVSPDAGWPILSEFFKKTTRSMTVGMYDFSAPHVVAAFEQAMKRAAVRSVELVLDPGLALTNGGGEDNPKKDDVKEDEVKTQLEDAL